MLITVTVDAAPERVFGSFTDPDELASWFWPPRLETVYRLDAREGGEFHIRSGAMGFGVHGRYLEVRPDRLAMTWQWDGEDEQSEVLVTLRAAGDGRTDVTVTHGGNPTVAARDLHEQGWRDCLGRLVERCAAG